MRNLKQLRPIALALGLAVASFSAQAVLIGQGLVGGDNTLIDESREAYVDANTNGKFDAGDVIFGYIRISDFQPGGSTGNNQVYGVFSQQIASTSAGRNVDFVATTVNGLTLKDLLGGNMNVGVNSLAAFFDSPTPYTDLINSNPPGPPANMQGYIDYINNNGTLELVAGFSDFDDFLYSEITTGAFNQGIQIGSSNAAFATAGASLTLANNSGAFSLSYNNTGRIFNDLVPVLNPYAPGFILAEVAVSSGTTAGSAGAVNPDPKNWLDAGPGYVQCATTTPGVDANCGFIDKNNFSVNVIPEPGSLALVSMALFGLTGFARRRKNRA